ncbi:hypothetical protein [Halopelagius inordinatus]|uniref:hypothetical protein n=1 Tax=Halopelagius inordinatus TaxID=553467 RepID=UPI000B81F703|nr:hypothetical protein [Halopelagius inordinatus]
MTVKSSLRRIAEVDDSVTERDDIEQQYEMYQKTLESLEDIDADDENEGVTVVTEWIVDQIETNGKRPSSKAVRQHGAKFCRNNGYEIPNDSWLGR